MAKDWNSLWWFLIIYSNIPLCKLFFLSDSFLLSQYMCSVKQIQMLMFFIVLFLQLAILIASTSLLYFLEDWLDCYSLLPHQIFKLILLLLSASCNIHNSKGKSVQKKARARSNGQNYKQVNHSKRRGEIIIIRPQWQSCNSGSMVVEKGISRKIPIPGICGPHDTSR